MKKLLENDFIVPHIKNRTVNILERIIGMRLN